MNGSRQMWCPRRAAILAPLLLLLAEPMSAEPSTSAPLDATVAPQAETAERESTGEQAGRCPDDDAIADALRVVGDDYVLGKFQAILDRLEPCASGRMKEFDRRQKKLALIYLAKAYLALDRDEQAERTVQLLRALQPDFDPEDDPDPEDVVGFQAVVARIIAAGARITASSVSKTPEDLRETPATIIVITAEEIARRGYVDLEQALHDLPGFNISRGNGVVYSNLYLRGYRAVSNDRFLFLVDGVEENDLWSNTAFISRQYPLSNVDRIEVLYGPASTIYGPNAFAGVINVYTRGPAQLLESEESRFAVRAEIGGGTWETRFVDATIAGRLAGNEEVAFSLTARSYVSDEMDRSGFEDWDFSPRFYEELGYAGVLDVEAQKAQAVWNSLTPTERQGLRDSGLVTVAGTAPGTVSSITLTPAGIAAARARDLAGLTGFSINGRPVGFSERTEDWSAHARLKIYDLELGFMTWRREEGSNGWYVDRFRAGADNGNLWIPEQTFFYLKYERDLGDSAGLTLLSRFKRHKIGSGSANSQVWNFSNRRLDIADLALGTRAFWQVTDFAHTSRQLRTDLTLVYRPSDKLNLVGGLEVRSGMIQGDYQLAVDFLGDEPLRADTRSRIADRTRNDTARQFTDQLDVGLFAQASFWPSERCTDLPADQRRCWKLVAGARVDSNDVDPVGDFDNPATVEVERPEGYGTVFNPRLAVLHFRRDWVFKAVYAEAFKDASNFNRYATSPGVRDLQNPSLASEKVKNLELSAAWEKRIDLGDPAAAEGREPPAAGEPGRRDLSWDVSLYRADFSDAVGQVPVTLPNTTITTQNRNVGSREILGLQSNFRLRQGRWDLFANYTYTDPEGTITVRGTDPERTIDARIRDIAEHQLNLGLNAEVGEAWNLNLRLNYVGDRERGSDTTALNSPLPTVGSYLVANSAVTYRPRASRFELQLLIHNLLDESYYDPGIRTGTGAFASRLPQNERSVFLRVTYSF